MVKIPCKECITFAMCKQRIRWVESKGARKGQLWLTLYWSCSIFSKFYDWFLCGKIKGSETVDFELEKLYEVQE